MITINFYSKHILKICFFLLLFSVFSISHAEETLPDFTKIVGAIRRPGSAALDLAYVASGRYDGFWEFGLKPWDVAAGVLLIQEAGGIVQNIIPDTDPVDSGSLFCGNPKIFEAMKEVLSHYDKRLKAFA